MIKIFDMAGFYFGASNLPSEGPYFHIYSANTDGTSTLGRSGVNVYISATGYSLSGTEYVEVITHNETSDGNGNVSFPVANEWKTDFSNTSIVLSPEFYSIQKVSLSFTYLGRTYYVTNTGTSCYGAWDDIYVGPQNEDGVVDTWNISPTFKNTPIPIDTRNLSIINVSGKCTNGTLKTGNCLYSISTANVCTSVGNITTYKTFSKKWTSGAGTNFTKWTSAWTVPSWPNISLSTANNILAATASPFYVTAITATVLGGSSTTQQWDSVTKYHTITGSTSSTTTTSVKLDNVVIPQTITRSGVTFQSTSGYMDATGGKWKIYNTLSSARTDENNMIWSGWVTNNVDNDSTITISGNTNASISVERDGFETFNADASSLNTDETAAYPWEVTVELNKDENNPKLATINNFKEGSAWKAFGRTVSGSISGSADWADRVMTYASVTDVDGSDGVQRQYPPILSNVYYMEFSTPSFSGESENYEWEEETALINSGKTLPKTYHSMSSWATNEDGLGIICPRAIKSSDILRNTGIASTDGTNGATNRNPNKTIVPNGFVDARFVFNGEETTSVPYNWCVSGVQTSGYVMASTLPHKYLTTDLARWQMASAGTMSGVSGMRGGGPHGVSGDEVYFIVSCVSANTSTTNTLTATFNPGRDNVSDSVTVSQSPKPNVTFKGDTAQGTTFLFYFGWDEFGSECAHTATVTLANAVSWSGDIPSSSEALSVTIPYTSTIVAYPTAKMLAGKNFSGKKVLELYPKAFDRWGNSAYTDGEIRSIMAYISGVPSASGCTIKKINNSISSTATEVTSLTYLATNSGISAANYFYVHFSAASTYYTYRITTKSISGATNSFYWGFYSQSTTSGYVSFCNYPKSANTSTTPNIVQYTITPISKYKYHDGTYISGVSKTITITQVAGGGASSTS